MSDDHDLTERQKAIRYDRLVELADDVLLLFKHVMMPEDQIKRTMPSLQRPVTEFFDLLGWDIKLKK